MDSSSRRQIGKILLGIILIGALLLAFHWRPARQVHLHQKHFLHAVEERNWPAVKAQISPDYRDRWHQDRQMILQTLPQAFQDFLALGVVNSDETMEGHGKDFTVSTRLRIVGSGGPISQMVVQQADALKQPFVFKWRRQSWRPWDWALVEVNQPELEAPQGLELP